MPRGGGPVRPAGRLRRRRRSSLMPLRRLARTCFHPVDRCITQKTVDARAPVKLEQAFDVLQIVLGMLQVTASRARY